MNTSERERETEPVVVPQSLMPFVEGMSWARDTVGESGATIHRLHASGRPSLYLKHGHGSVAQDLTEEMARMQWLAHHASVPELRGFVATGDEAWLLMSAMPGRTAYDLLEAEPGKRSAIVSAIARHLRKLHALAVEECPFNSAHTLRLAAARRRMEAGKIEISDFDEEREGWTAEQVWMEMTALLPLEADPVVTHGDYSLDNILLENGSVAGLIDLGRVGIADRYQDLAILANCLREFGEDLQEQLFAVYGIAQPDECKLRFHLMLDEFF